MSDKPSQQIQACVRFNTNVQAFIEFFGLENVNPVVDQLRERILVWVSGGNPFKGDLFPQVNGIIRVMRYLEFTPDFLEYLGGQQ